MISWCGDFVLSIVMVPAHRITRVCNRVFYYLFGSGRCGGKARRRVSAMASYVFLTLLMTQPVGATDEVAFSVEEQARIRLHGPWPVPVPPDPGNEYSGLRWAEEAGRLLFNDSGLSGNKAISCASCHQVKSCLLYTSPSPRDRTRSRMPSSA